MNKRSKSSKTWDDIRRSLKDGERALADLEQVPHPIDAGARRTSNWPRGQVADYAISGPTGTPPLVVQEFESHFEAFVDGVRLTEAAATIAENDPTTAMYLGGALFGGAIGASFSNKREGAFVGAGVGLLIAAVLDSNRRSRGA